ncbi:MAG: helix-turn-helix transcriptional regulator [Chitinophagales bacterium]|nr:helix-turn-helix transcriptional regulator [Chitinophagales bacterium]
MYPKVYLYRRIVQSKLFIDSHYPDIIDIDNIANEAFYSKFHFIRSFKKIYGKTPHQYLISVRIEKAKALLENGVSIAEVCHSVGFDSISSFCGLFKRMVDKTPSLYQKQQRITRADIIKVPLKYIPHCFAEKNEWLKKSNFQEVIL